MDNQRWRISGTADGYAVKAKHSGLSMAPTGTGSTNGLVQVVDGGVALQRWTPR